MVAIALFDQVKLIPKRRPWTNERHVALDDIEQLWKFIKTRFSEKLSNSCNEGIRILKQMRRHIFRRIRAHGSKLQNAEIFLISSYSLLPEEYRTSGIKFDQDHENQKYR